MVIIGSARHDENGKLRGGKSGDQGGEVETEKFYKARAGWRCFRPKEESAAFLIAQDMQAACFNDHIGYDQGNNQSLYNAVKNLHFDCSKLNTDEETDCSQLARVCILYAGINIPMFSTADMPQYLLATGAFMEMTGAGYTLTGKDLKRGDILCTKVKGHCAVVLTDGDNVKRAGKLTLTGDWNKTTTARLQQFLNTPIDGEIWRQNARNKKYLTCAGSGWIFKLANFGAGSPVIRALQKMTGASVDGIAGRNTALKLQQYLNSRGYYLRLTGIADTLTAAMLQLYLNDQL